MFVVLIQMSPSLRAVPSDCPVAASGSVALTIGPAGSVLSPVAAAKYGLVES